MSRESQEVKPRSRTVIELDIAGLTTIMMIFRMIFMIFTILMIIYDHDENYDEDDDNQ